MPDTRRPQARAKLAQIRNLRDQQSSLRKSKADTARAKSSSPPESTQASEYIVGGKASDYLAPAPSTSELVLSHVQGALPSDRGRSGVPKLNLKTVEAFRSEVSVICHACRRTWHALDETMHQGNTPYPNPPSSSSFSSSS